MEYLLSYLGGLLVVFGAIVALLLWLGVHLWIWVEVIEELFGIDEGSPLWQIFTCAIGMVVAIDVLPWIVGLSLFPPWGS